MLPATWVRNEDHTFGNYFLQGKKIKIWRQLWFTVIISWFSLTCLGQAPSSGFRIQYSSTARVFTSTQHLNTRDNATVIAGKWGSTDDSADLMVMKIGQSGQVLWSKRVPLKARLDNYFLCELSDGSIICAANSIYNDDPYYSSIFLFKFICNGDLGWSKIIARKIAAPQKFIYPYSLREGKNNDFILTIVTSSTVTTGQSSIISRIDQSGKPVWSKTFTGFDATNTTFPMTAFVVDDKVVVFGYKSTYSNFYAYSRTLFAMKLNYNNGALETVKGYSYFDAQTNYGQLVTDSKIHFYAEQLDNKKFALFGEFSYYSRTDSYFYTFLLNPDLSVWQSTVFTVPVLFGREYAKMSVMPNGQTHHIVKQDDSKKVYWYTADSASKVIRSIKMPYSGDYIGLPYKVSQNGAGHSTYVFGVFKGNKNFIEAGNVADNDITIKSCLGAADTSYVKQQSWPLNQASWSWKSVTDNELDISEFAVGAFDITVTQNSVCKPADNSLDVKQLKIQGAATACFSGSPVVYTAVRKNNSQGVYWSIDPSWYQSMNRLTDTTVSIVFQNPVARPQQVKLYAYSGTCELLQDSATVTLYPPGNKLPDSIGFCSNSVRLQPGSWFKSYRWQDGSTDSVYTVTKPGKYTVQLETYCGTIFHDSVQVVSKQTSTVRYLTLCKADSITLHTVGGLTNYVWTPGYNMIPISDSVVTVYPEKDAAYILHATTADGCAYIDSTFITVSVPLGISLGSDTALCKQQKLTLDAGTGFQSYLWNTGAVTQTYAATGPGNYSVRALSPNGCYAKDTIHVEEKECINRIRIPTAFTPNHDGINDVFTPLVLGTLEKYSFAVYNRWGELVFSSTKPNLGWDGTVRGNTQQSNTFVWVCNYKFLNEPQRMEKGTVILLR